MNRQATKPKAEPEILPPANELAQLPREMAIVKMENDSIASMAAAHPRDYGSVLGAVKEQLEQYPSFARETIYRKPVGKDPKTGEMKFARGLSIRAAEAIAEAYGYNRVRTAIDIIDDNTVRVSATFTDFQRGRIWEDSGILTKFYRTKGGKMERIADDRFFNVVAKAEVSKRAREVITRSVPPGLRSELFEIAEAAMGRLMTPEETDKVLGAFGKLKVTPVMLEKYLGAPIDEWTQDHRIALRETYTALKDGEMSVDELAGGGNGHEQAEGPKDVSLDDLTGE